MKLFLVLSLILSSFVYANTERKIDAGYIQNKLQSSAPTTPSAGFVSSFYDGTGEPKVVSSSGDVYSILYGTGAQSFDGDKTFSGTITAPEFVGNITGNVTGNVTGSADTADAFTVDPSDCPAGQKATGSAANGDLLCSAVDLTAGVSGTLPTTSGGTGTNSTFTQGSVVFASSSGNYGQDNSYFYYDPATKKLCIGCSSPTYALHMKAIGTNYTDGMVLEGNGSNAARFWNYYPENNGFLYIRNPNLSFFPQVYSNTGLTGIGITPDSSAQMTVMPSDTSISGVLIKNAAGQVAKPFLLENNAGTIELASIDRDGNAAVQSLTATNSMILEDPDSGTNKLTLKATSSINADFTINLPFANCSGGDYLTLTDGSIVCDTPAGGSGDVKYWLIFSGNASNKDTDCSSTCFIVDQGGPTGSWSTGVTRVGAGNYEINLTSLDSDDLLCTASSYGNTRYFRITAASPSTAIYLLASGDTAAYVECRKYK